MLKKIILILVLPLMAFSCEKGAEEVKPESLPVTKFTLSVEPYNTRVLNVELFISEPNGRMLIDTVVSTHQMHIIGVRSLEKLFTVTTVRKDDFYPKDVVDTYVQVNPDNWRIVSGNNFHYLGRQTTPTYQKSSLSYLNVPEIVDGKYYFYNSYGSGTLGTILNNSQHRLDVQYDKYEGNYTYLVIPSLGLYKIAPVQNDKQIIDLSQMDKAVKVKLTTPTNLPKPTINLYGYPKQNDYNNSLWLYSNRDGKGHSLDGDFDIIYPSGHINDYQLLAWWHDATTNFYEYYSLASSVPTQLDVIDDSYVKIDKLSANDFKLQFLKEEPTFHATTWETSNIQWTVYAPATVTSFNLQKIMDFLNSSTYLKGRSFSELKLRTLTLQKAEGFNHQAFFDNVFNPDITKEKKIRKYQKFRKNID